MPSVLYGNRHTTWGTLPLGASARCPFAAGSTLTLAQSARAFPAGLQRNEATPSAKWVSFRDSPPSVRMTWICACFSPRLEENASWSPPGDHLGLSSLPSPVVNWYGPPPQRGRSQMQDV